MIIDVAAGLVFHEGRLLITQRRPDDHLGGLWEFPGGKVETDENFPSCLIRELREELGIEVAVHELIAEITHAYPEKTVHLKFFHCGLLSGLPKPIHCAAVAWVKREELRLFKFPDADAKLLESLATCDVHWTYDPPSIKSGTGNSY
jgi:8-oxo-dGTP diphosphatase